MTTPVARRQAAPGTPPPTWLLSALVHEACAVLPNLDTKDPACACVARDFTGVTLAEWGADALVFDAQLVISELVTNAMRHAGGVVQLRLVRSGAQVACVVSDGSVAPPTLAAEDCFAESGRGLHLVQALTSSWGWIAVHDQGKLVWAILNG